MTDTATALTLSFPWMPTWPGPSQTSPATILFQIFLERVSAGMRDGKVPVRALEKATQSVSGAGLSTHRGEVVVGSHFSFWVVGVGSQRSATGRKRERQDALEMICKGRLDNFCNPKWGWPS